MYAATRIVAFAELFGIFKDHAGVRNTQAEIAAYYYSLSSDSRSPMVPKIIHQIFHNWHDENNDTIPAKWQPSRQSCLDLNPDWEQMVKPIPSILFSFFLFSFLHFLYFWAGGVGLKEKD
jgi:hypothetical protein